MKQALLRALVWLGGISRTLAEFLLPILAGATASALEAILPVALDTVRELATRGDLSGAEKREVAIERLRGAAVDTGLRVGTSTLALAVEVALQKLREVR